jgi:hypothetical protein
MKQTRFAHRMKQTRFAHRMKQTRFAHRLKQERETTSPAAGGVKQIASRTE